MEYSVDSATRAGSLLRTAAVTVSWLIFVASSVAGCAIDTQHVAVIADAKTGSDSSSGDAATESVPSPDSAQIPPLSLAVVDENALPSMAAPMRNGTRSARRLHLVDSGSAVSPLELPTALPPRQPSPTPSAVAPIDSSPPTASPGTATLERLPSEPGQTMLVAAAKPSITTVETFDQRGNPTPLHYEYLHGNKVNYAVKNPTYFGTRLHLLIVSGDSSDEFIEVLMPVRPAGATAWVRTSDFEIVENDFFIEVNVTHNSLRAWKGTELLVDTQVATGRSDRPTPVLRTYVDEVVPGPAAAYGPNMLTLAAFSESLNTFGSDNGLPKLAIHGTNQPDLLGGYVSSGCVRVRNDVISRLAAVIPPGTPVDIVR